MHTQPPVAPRSPDRSPNPLAVLDFLRPVSNHSSDQSQGLQHHQYQSTSILPKQGQEQNQGELSPTIRPSKRRRRRSNVYESFTASGVCGEAPDTMYSVPSVSPIDAPDLRKLPVQSQMHMQSSEQRQTSQQGQASGDRPRGRTRGPTACEVCRARRTKCDGQRPTCGYFSKINAECSYLEDEANPHS